MPINSESQAATNTKSKLAMDKRTSLKISCVLIFVPSPVLLSKRRKFPSS